MSVADEPVTKQDLLNAVADLKSYVDARAQDTEGRLKNYVDARAQDMEGRLKSYVDERSQDMEGRIVTALKSYVDERCEKVETRLLTAFHGWARTMEIKIRGVSTITSGFDERLSFMEERVSQLERKAS